MNMVAMLHRKDIRDGLDTTLNTVVNRERGAASFDIIVCSVFQKRPACPTKDSRGWLGVDFGRIVSYYVRVEGSGYDKGFVV